MDHSLPFRRCAEQALAAGVTSVRLDLGRCTYMDSTFLGTLFILKKAADQKEVASLTLTALSPQCHRLLKQMRLVEYYTIQPMEELPAEAWTELATARGDCGVFRNNVLQAHQELANLEGPAGEPFREVMRCVARDLERQQSGPGPAPPADGGTR
jgi:anti-anti-sigma regulatory factor